MLINEISPQEQMQLNMTKWKSVQQLRNFLKKKGYKRLGKGLFSEVYGKTGAGSVIKISTREDVCWLRYARWVLKQPPNAHLPRISSIRTYETEDGDKLFVSRLERLNEIYDIGNGLASKIQQEKDPRKVAEMLWILSLYIRARVPFGSGKGRAIDLLKKSTIRKDPQFKGMTPEEIYRKIMKSFSSSKLSRTISAAQKQILKDKNCYADLHDGNMMQRDDGTLVLMDPAAMYCESGAVSS